MAARILARLVVALAITCLAGAARAQSISALAAQAAADSAADQEPAEPRKAAATTPAQLDVAVPVPAVTLYPGDVLRPSVLTRRQLPASVLDQGGLASREEAVMGKEVRRVLAAGQPIPLNSLTDVTLVTKGAPTRVHLNEGGLTISGYATALESGAVGAIVRLKNMDSGQVIVGEVEPDGSVRIKMQ